MNKVIVEVNIIPLGTKTPSVRKYVAEALKILKQSGAKYELTAMGTVIEGYLEEVLDLIKEMHQAVFCDGIQRVVTTVRIDERRDKELTIEEKKRLKFQEI